MAALSVLERKIDRHIKENAHQIKTFKFELQTLKGSPKSRVVRPSSELLKSKDFVKANKADISPKPPTNLTKNAVTASMPSINIKTPKKSASFCLTCDLFQFVVNEALSRPP